MTQCVHAQVEPAGTLSVEQPRDPFETLYEVPNVVDAAAVLNNPADMLLLSNSGKSIRALLSFAGVFPQSEHAFSALAQVFQTDTDETIRALLGGRVLVMWDGVDQRSDTPLAYADFFDTQWTILCEVDEEYIKQIQKHLEPIPRRIERGVGVYAIEKGRYELVVFSPTVSDATTSSLRTARVLLAPQKAKPLLNHVIESVVEMNKSTDRVFETPRVPMVSSIMHQRSALTQGLGQRVGLDSTWSIAWIVQLDEFFPKLSGASIDSLKSGSKAKKQTKSPVVAGMVSSTPSGVKINFASDLPLTLPTQDAPVGLLSAVGTDAIFAMAVAQSPQFFVNERSLSVDLNLGADQDGSDMGSGLLGGPSLILFSEMTHKKAGALQDPQYALSMLSLFEPLPSSNVSGAKRVDALMQGLIGSIDEFQAPMHQGRFSSAVRTHDLRLPTKNNPVDTDPDWLRNWVGNEPRVSWIASETHGQSSAMILSVSSAGSQTAQQVRWVEKAHRTLCAIPDRQSNSGVLASGYMRPSKALSMFDSTSTMDLVISKLIDRVRWEVVRAPVGVRGEVEFEFTHPAMGSLLGNPDHK